MASLDKRSKAVNANDVHNTSKELRTVRTSRTCASKAHIGVGGSVPGSVPKGGPTTILWQPTPTTTAMKTGLKSSVSGPFCNRLPCVAGTWPFSHHRVSAGSRSVSDTAGPPRAPDFGIASRSLLDSRMFSRRSLRNVPSHSGSTWRARACHPWRISIRRARRSQAAPSRRSHRLRLQTHQSGSRYERRRAASAAGTFVSWLSKPCAAIRVQCASGCGSTSTTMRTRVPSGMNSTCIS
jgi:hypothetical protein